MGRKPKLKLQPTAGYILIEPEEVQKQTKSGIYLPDTHEGEKPQIGSVLAVGPTMLHESGQKINSPCKVGQKIVYKKWGGNEYKTEDDKELIFVKFEDIMAIVN